MLKKSNNIKPLFAIFNLHYFFRGKQIKVYNCDTNTYYNN